MYKKTFFFPLHKFVTGTPSVDKHHSIDFCPSIHKDRLRARKITDTITFDIIYNYVVPKLPLGIES